MLSTILISLHHLLISAYTLIQISLFKIYWENKIKLKAPEEREPMLPWFLDTRVQPEGHRLFTLQERVDSESAVFYTEVLSPKVTIRRYWKSKTDSRLRRIVRYVHSSLFLPMDVSPLRHSFLVLQNFVCGLQVNINLPT